MCLVAAWSLSEWDTRNVSQAVNVQNYIDRDGSRFIYLNYMYVDEYYTRKMS